jgi:hypothetical protein
MKEKEAQTQKAPSEQIAKMSFADELKKKSPQVEMALALAQSAQLEYELAMLDLKNREQEVKKTVYTNYHNAIKYYDSNKKGTSLNEFEASDLVLSPESLKTLKKLQNVLFKSNKNWDRFTEIIKDRYYDPIWSQQEPFRFDKKDINPSDIPDWYIPLIERFSEQDVQILCSIAQSKKHEKIDSGRVDNIYKALLVFLLEKNPAEKINDFIKYTKSFLKNEIYKKDENVQQKATHPYFLAQEVLLKNKKTKTRGHYKFELDIHDKETYKNYIKQSDLYYKKVTQANAKASKAENSLTPNQQAELNAKMDSFMAISLNQKETSSQLKKLFSRMNILEQEQSKQSNLIQSLQSNLDLAVKTIQEKMNTLDDQIAYLAKDTKKKIKQVDKRIITTAQSIIAEQESLKRQMFSLSSVYASSQKLAA